MLTWKCSMFLGQRNTVHRLTLEKNKIKQKRAVEQLHLLPAVSVLIRGNKSTLFHYLSKSTDDTGLQ